MLHSLLDIGYFNEMKRILFISILLLVASNSQGQSCDCVLDEVLNNAVQPCNKTIGTVVEVSNGNEFVQAIREANRQGGNMTILIEDGKHVVASTASYPYLTASDVVIRSKSGNRDAVILAGQGMRDAQGVENVISVQGDRVTIADLTIADCANHGIATSADSLTIYNVRIQNTYEQMIKGNKDADGNTGGVVRCCLLEYTQGIGPNWYIGGVDIHDGHGWHVSDNAFYGIRSPGRSVAEHAVHFWSGSSGTIVQRNVIVNCDRGIGFGLGNSPHFGGQIDNNVVVNMNPEIFTDVGIGLESTDSAKVFHNTIMVAYPNAIEYRFQSSVGNEIRNNLTNARIRSRDGGSAEVSHNYTAAEIDWFVSGLSGDMKLKHSRPEVVDQGIDVGLMWDSGKNNRFQGSAPDLGAYEWSESTGVSDQTEAQVNFFKSQNSCRVILNSETEDEWTYSLLDLTGTVLRIGQLKSGENVLFMSNIPPGIYHVQARARTHTEGFTFFHQ